MVERNIVGYEWIFYKVFEFLTFSYLLFNPKGQTLFVFCSSWALILTKFGANEHGCKL